MISAFLVTNQTDTLTRREIIECLFSNGDEEYVVCEVCIFGGLWK